MAMKSVCPLFLTCSLHRKGTLSRKISSTRLLFRETGGKPFCLKHIIQDYTFTSFTDGDSGKVSSMQETHKRLGWDPWIGKIPWRRAWQPLQYSCLENPMERGAWQATVHRATQSWTRLGGWAWTHTRSTDFQQKVPSSEGRNDNVFSKWCWNNWETTCKSKNNKSLCHPYSFPCGSAGKESACNAGD